MNEQNLKLETIKNRCKTSAKVISILQIFARIGIIGALVGAIICFAMKDTVNSSIAKEIASGNLTVDSLKFETGTTGILHFKINFEEAYKNGDYATPLTITCVLSVILTSVCLYLLKAFKKIFVKLYNEDNPFSDTILSSLKICFIVITVILVVFVGIGPGVIGGLLCWCIYSILEYAKLLQTEVDEIL